MRRAWLQIHLWLGLSLGLLGAVVRVTGSILVFDQPIDRALNPQRYAMSGSSVALPYIDYAQRAARAVGAEARTLTLRLPTGEGTPGGERTERRCDLHRRALRRRVAAD